MTKMVLAFREWGPTYSEAKGFESHRTKAPVLGTYIKVSLISDCSSL